MRVSAMIDEETDIQSEHPQQPSRTDSLITRIKTNTGDEPVILGSQSYYDLSTQEVEAVLEAVDENLNITAIEVTATVSGNGADRIIDGFIAGNVTDLTFDILYRVDDPSQARLTRYMYAAEDKVETYNLREEQRTTGLLTMFRRAQPLKRKRDDEPVKYIPALPDDILREELKPAIQRKKTARFEF